VGKAVYTKCEKEGIRLLYRYPFFRKKVWRPTKWTNSGRVVPDRFQEIYLPNTDHSVGTALTIVQKV